MNQPPLFWIQEPWHLALFSLFAFFIYFFPSILAFYKSHPKKRDLFLLNLLLGWTLLGWCLAFIWCFLDTTEET